MSTRLQAGSVRSRRKGKGNTRRKQISWSLSILDRLAASGDRERQEKQNRFFPPVSLSHFLGWLGGLCIMITVVGMLSMGFVAGFRWVTTSSYFALKDIRVQGMVRLTTQEVVDYAQIEPDTNILDLKIADIEARLRKQLWIRSVFVRRILPDRLQITIKEHQPHYWLRVGEELFYVTAQGEHIARVGAQNFVSLPLLSIETGAWDHMQNLKQQLALLDTAGLPVGMAQAAHIDVRVETVRILFTERVLELTVSFDDFTENIRRLEQVWNDLKWRGEHTQVKAITVFGKKAWVRS